MAAPMLAALCVLLALALDRGLGEPPARLHPVVWMGHWLGWFSRWLPTLPAKAGFCAGTLAWLLGALGVLALALALHTWVLRPLAVQQPALAVLLGAVLLKPLLAWRMLREEVRAVDAALAQSVPAGRQQLARLVSRDTSQLSPAAVREAAIETLAENLNDSVVAPLFWFAVAACPAPRSTATPTPPMPCGATGAAGNGPANAPRGWMTRFPGCPPASPRCCCAWQLGSGRAGARCASKRSAPLHPTAAGLWVLWLCCWAASWANLACMP